MAKKPVSAANSIQAMLEQDPLKLAAIGREAGLEMFRNLIAESDNASKTLLLKEAYELELEIVKAAEQRNQVVFDTLNVQSKELFEKIKFINNLTS